MRKGIKTIFICFSLFVVMFWFHGHALAGKASETIKVGYLEQCELIYKQAGKAQGMAVDYFDLIAQHTGWEYEYIAVTRQQAQESLNSGQVDILCLSQHEKEWQNRFLYSEATLGFEYFLIYSDKDSDIYYDDYQAMDGLRTGVLSDNHYIEELYELMQDEGFGLELVYYDTKEDMLAAFEEGGVDLFVTGSYDSYHQYKLVSRFGGQPIYCITKQEKKALMDEFDSTLQTVKIQQPTTVSDLLSNYFSNRLYSCGPLYTREEHEYIENAEPVKVNMRLRSHPLSYSSDGEYGGIFVDFMQLLSEKSGLEFELVMDTETLPLGQRIQSMKDNDYLVFLPGRVVRENEIKDVIVSNSLIRTNLSYVKRRDKAGIEGRRDYIFALTEDMNYLVPLLQEESSEYSFLYFASTEECLEAVYDGTADIAIQDNYAVSYALQKPQYAEHLAVCPGEEFSMDFCLVAEKDNQILMQILNKAIEQIEKDSVEKLVTTELFWHPYQMSIWDWFYKYRRVLIFTVFFMVLGIVVYSILLRKMTALSIQRKDYESLKDKVQQDLVTGVYNRYSFYDKAREMLYNSSEVMYIVMADIANFKVVNDLYGMDMGDQLLSYMAKAFLELGKERNMIVARFTGDHFYMCLSAQDFHEIAFPQRFKTFLQDMEITVSYGVFQAEPQMNIPVNIMCDRANLAAHDKEQKSVGYIRYYSDEERNRIIQKQEIENDMEKALENHQFCVYVQPKYDINEGTIVGGEALVRWKHPQKGMISPGVFIDIFEKNGFIVQLDYYVWEETCRILADLKAQGISGYPVSINVSRAHFYGTDILNKLTELIEKYQLQPQDLELEITESICGEDSEVIYQKIRNLQHAGFKVAMDDFGSGYSSLNMLKEMPLDIIKMDLKFLDGGEDEEKSRNILYTLISLAQNLNLFVVVEGVETEDQVEFLRQIGNHYVQGYYFSRPVESAVYENMLKARS